MRNAELSMRVTDGRLVVRGVPAGLHAFIVGAPGRESLAYRLVLREGETRRTRPLLPP